MRTMEQYPFLSSQLKVLWFHASLKVSPKNTLSSDQIGLTDS